jgi:protein-S-isoprenylcysteine O-methyltransferase
MLQSLSRWLGWNLPEYGMAGAIVLVLYVVEAEIRFGSKARSSSAGESDRGSTRYVSLSAMVPMLGFVLAMKARAAGAPSAFHAWLIGPRDLPGLPAVAWVGVVAGLLGLLVRLWALLTLRHRFTRTLLVHEGHTVERGGPYRFVRHPGYLGSLMTLNGVALASGSAPVFVASLAATSVAYAHRIRAEDAMLVAAFGEAYESYRREVGALFPFVR